MLKKLVVIGGIAAVAGLGLGGVAMANSNSSAPSAVVVAQGSVAGDAAAPAGLTTGTAGTAKPDDKVKKAKGGRHHGLKNRFEHVAHAQWVSKDAKTGTFITHDAVRGDVTAVSGTSITIKAADGNLETFTVNSATKVHVKVARGVKKAWKTPGSISMVKVGDRAGVLGTGTSAMIATQVIDRGVAGAHKSKVSASASEAPATS